MAKKYKKGFWFRFIGLMDVFRSLFFFLFIFLPLLVVVPLLIYGSLGEDDDAAAIDIDEGSVLVFDPSGIVSESRPDADPVDQLVGEFSGNDSESWVWLRDLTDVLIYASEDDRVGALLLRLDELRLRQANVADLGAAIARFKESGKPVYAYSSFPEQHQFWLASYADESYLHPLGGAFVVGYGGHYLYMAGLLEKLGIDFHVYRTGRYKSAGETLVRERMSDAQRETLEDVLDVIWPAYLEALAELRGLSPQDIRSHVNNYDKRLKAAGSHANAALETGLVDGLKTYRETLSLAASAAGGNGGETEESDDQPPKVSYDDYLPYARGQRDGEETLRGDHIALIVAEGPVTMSSDGPGDRVVAQSVVTKRIRRARDDENVKALVLRLNTPGGGVMASELIREELELFRAKGKPVVVSMSAVAASGGYWIATAADEIWASPLTLTGSIGVISLIPSIEKGLGKIGIRKDGVASSPLAEYIGIGAPPPRWLIPSSRKP